MTPSQSATARAKTNAADPAVAGLERPTPAGANAPGFGSDVIADALRSLDIPYIALDPGRELSRPARQHRQLSRQFVAADAALPA